MEVRRLDLDQWDRRLPSSGFDVFHTAAALSVVDDHADAELQLLGGFKGEEPVGLLPVFVRETRIGRAAYSPPPSMGIPHMGPVLMPTSPKRRKIERVNRTFSEAVADELALASRFTLFHMVGSPTYTDPRPFEWTDQSVEPRFTYVVDVDGDAAGLTDDFTSDLRREIRKGEELGITVDVEGSDAAERVARDVVERYDDQDETAPFTVGFATDLVEALDDRARTYVARDPDGGYLGGIIALFSNDLASFWQGGVRRSYDGVSPNGRLHWRVVNDVADGDPFDSVTGYDLVGANTARLSEYKAKFGPELVPYYVVESAGPEMDVAKAAYQVVRR